MLYPKDYHFTKDHEWLKVEGKEAVIGVTDFAQKQLGDVVFVELPQIGKKLDVHSAIGVIESVKAVSDVYSPASGEVIAGNEALSGSPELINQDPHVKGWIIRIKLANVSDLDKLMTAADYEKYVEGLAH